MATDTSWVGQAMAQTVPWVGSMDLEFGVVWTLRPNRPANHS